MLHYTTYVYDYHRAHRTGMERLRDMEISQRRGDTVADFEAHARNHRWFRIPDSIRT